MSSPAFQFYPAEYLADEKVQLMTLEEEGAYVRALCYCWREGSIPADETALARLIGKGGSTTVARVVQAAFVKCLTNGSRMVHPRLDKERQKQVEWREKSRQGGLKSASGREQKRNSKGGSSGPVQPKGNSLSSSLSSSVQNTPAGAGSPHNVLITLWTAEYMLHHKTAYVFQGGKDGTAVKTLLSTGKSPEELVSIAKQVWNSSFRMSAFLQGFTVTISGFASKINEFQNELSKLNGHVSHVPKELSPLAAAALAQKESHD